jgi:hypothetical protein
MEIYLDDQPVTTGRTPATFGEAITLAKDMAAKDNRVIVSVLCDGQDVSNDDIEVRETDPGESCARVDFESGRPDQLVREAMSQALDVLDDTEAKRQQVVAWLTQGQSRQAAEALTDCFRSWAQVHTAIIQSIVMLDLDLETLEVNGQGIEAALLTIADQLRQVKEMLEAGDYVLLADLLQHEFGQATDRWRGAIEAIQARLEPSATG